MATVELVGYVVADTIYERFSSTPNKKLSYLGYSISIIGAATIIINNNSIPILDMIGEFITKFGIAISF